MSSCSDFYDDVATHDRDVERAQQSAFEGQWSKPAQPAHKEPLDPTEVAKAMYLQAQRERMVRRKPIGPRTPDEIDAEKQTKQRPDLVPVRAILAMTRALSYGATKHGGGNTGRGTWRDAGTEQATVASHKASFLRHWLAYWSGEERDPESGLSHLDCCAAQLGILVDLIEDPPGDHAELARREAYDPATHWSPGVRRTREDDLAGVPG